MTLYIGVDFHPHQQRVSVCDTTDGEVHQASLAHNADQVRRFYKLLCLFLCLSPACRALHGVTQRFVKPFPYIKLRSSAI